jgi:hypothetical protein
MDEKNVAPKDARAFKKATPSPGACGEARARNKAICREDRPR